MEVSIKAAKEVNADLLAPELYRISVERGREARKEYRFKNFMQAKALANEARTYAEKAEFESIRNGGKREALPQDPLADPSYAPEAIVPPSGDSPSPTPPNSNSGTPFTTTTPSPDDSNLVNFPAASSPTPVPTRRK